MRKPAASHTWNVIPRPSARELGHFPTLVEWLTRNLDCVSSLTSNSPFLLLSSLSNSASINFIHSCLEILPFFSVSISSSNCLTSSSPSATLSCGFGVDAFCATPVRSMPPVRANIATNTIIWMTFVRLDMIHPRKRLPDTTGFQLGHLFSNPIRLPLAAQNTAATLLHRWSSIPTQAAPGAPPRLTCSFPAGQLLSMNCCVRCLYQTSPASAPDDNDGKALPTVPVLPRGSTYP